MRLSHNIFTVLVLFLVLSCAYAKDAYAYLDPGTGSYILQIVIAAVLGAAFTVKVFWLRIKTILTNLIARKPREK